ALSGLVGGLLSPAALQAATQDGGAASAALAELQSTLDALEGNFSSPEWNLNTPQDYAEARRVLLHTLVHGLQCWLEADPARPFFTSFINPHKKLLGDNPDARYFSAVIDDRHSYRIRGNLAGATYTSFTVEKGAGTDGGGGIAAALNDSELAADAEGNYEIIASPDKVKGNWLPLPKGASSITTRHYYENKRSINRDRMHHIPIDIRNLNSVDPRPAPSDADIAAGIRRVTTFIKGNVVPMTAQTDIPWVSRVPNQFPQPVRDGGNEDITYAAKDNVYSMAPWVLQPNQALIIRGRFPECRFANVVLFNRFLQTLNYEERTTSLNRAQAEQDEDGNFEMVIAHRDPGHPNWLDTEGRPFGIIFWRFQLPEGEIAPLRTKLIELPL
ncbi:MAG: DUF1214 domain-containing protein, partial [Halioglobus sp.]|nr:DUF1214 domain-containing protein [Halioglobus sp.]